MSAYEAAEWSDLFVMAGGASAALAGLVFVAVSINVDRILALEGMPDRALQALLQLLGGVVVSVLVLVPGQSSTALGIELLAVGLPLTFASWWLITRALRAGPRMFRYDPRRLLVVLGTAPFAVAGASLILEAGGGIYWVVGGLILAIVGAVTSAWVLLVEILR